MPTCPYCTETRPTEQGVRSHIEQTPVCREIRYNAYTAESDDDSDSESDANLGSDRRGDYGGGGGLDIPELVNAPSPPSDSDDAEEMNADPPRMDYSPAGSPLPADADPNPRKRHRASVEEVEDEDERWVQDFPEEFDAGKPLEQCETSFETFRAKQTAAGNPPWHPFESEDEWEVAQWLMTAGLSQKQIDKYLKLKRVREGIKPSFANNRAFLSFVDSLPAGPQWYCHAFELEGDECDSDGKPKKEIVEMWYRDPLECVRELLGNPSYTKQGYKPMRVYKRFKDGELSNREYTQMWTAEWWWEIQELLPPGATLAPIIIATDKTQLTRFSGDKQAWPPLRAAGKDGVKMDCADGFVRMIFPILSAYIADYPEQCLVACCRENACPRCLVKPKQRGEVVNSTMRDPDETLQVLADQSNDKFPSKFVDQNLRPINPFWADFPHCNIFSSMTPDILHELHNGVFGDHIVKWTTQATTGGDNEIDSRFRAMTPHPSLRHFAKGISLTSQWTGKEHKNMEKVFLGILAKVTEPAVQRAVGGIIDFIHYAHFEAHSDESLAKLDAAWRAFHNDKSVFVDLEIRKNFDVNKLHKLKHYVDSIRSRGTADGFNTENTERLHIDLAKAGYNASNRVKYTRQMTVWLTRQEAVYKFGTYLQWAVPGYGDEEDTSIAPPPPPEPEDLDDEEELDHTPSYRIAKKPAFPSITRRQSTSLTPPAQPNETSTFPVYSRFTVPLPKISEVSSHDAADTIRAARGEPAKMTPKGVKLAKQGQFDTILVRKDSPGRDQRPTDGISVARIRVIFRLPEDYGIFPDPLAYVDWYKPLQPPVANIRMHELSLSSRNHRQNSSIIPITDILRSCHLIPVFGRAVNPTWTSDRVLDQCKSFYLNPYLRHHDFYLFHTGATGLRARATRATRATGLPARATSATKPHPNATSSTSRYWAVGSCYQRYRETVA
ncbi:hypothetical protein DFH06DRAFT_1364378 [Mycena polygramma]|nr:hypothetical protein DFH06DRAFT_1364378 [Mycena polygramma]